MFNCEKFVPGRRCRKDIAGGTGCAQDKPSGNRQ